MSRIDDGLHEPLARIQARAKHRDMTSATPRTWTAALIVIGDEILSGRTQDKNVAQVATWLNVQGIRLKEVRVIADDMDAIVDGLITWVDDTANRVWPSGSAFATSSAPRTPAAPGLFSTTKELPTCSVSFCARKRVTVSTPPPGANGTMMRTGRVGQPCPELVEAV